MFTHKSVFTTLRLKEGNPLFLDWHLDRLARHFLLAFSKGYPRGLKKRVLERLGAEGRGIKSANVLRIRLNESDSLTIALEFGDPQVTLGKIPMLTKTCCWRGEEDFPELIKLDPDYENRRNWGQILGQNYLFFNDKEALGGLFFNFFFALDSQWFTPPLGPGVLAGITRRRFLEKEFAEERSLFWRDLKRVEKAFFCNSLREVIPIKSIDDRPLDV